MDQNGPCALCIKSLLYVRDLIENRLEYMSVESAILGRAATHHYLPRLIFLVFSLLMYFLFDNDKKMTVTVSQTLS